MRLCDYSFEVLAFNLIYPFCILLRVLSATSYQISDVIPASRDVFYFIGNFTRILLDFFVKLASPKVLSSFKYLRI